MKRLDAKIALGLFVSTFVVYALTSNKSMNQSMDTASTLVPAWELAKHGNLTLDHVYFPFPHRTWFFEAHGRIVSNRFPGAIFLAVPFYWLFARNTSAPTLLPAALTAAFVAAAAVAVWFLVARRLVSRTTAVMAALLFAFGTATWTVSADALWTHGPAQLALLIGILALAADRALPAGLGFGLAILCRPHLALVPAVTGLWASARARRLTPALWIALGSGVGLALFLLYTHLAYGSATVSGGYNQATLATGGARGSSLAILLSERVAGFLFSLQRGLLLWAPFLLALLPGLRSAWRAAPSWVRSSAVAGTAYMSFQLLHNGFDGGTAFYSYRLPLEFLTACAPLLLLAWREWTSRTVGRMATFVVLASLAVLMHAEGAIFYYPPRFQYSAWLEPDFLTPLREGPLAGVVAVGVGVVVLMLLALQWIDRAGAAKAGDAHEPVLDARQPVSLAEGAA